MKLSTKIHIYCSLNLPHSAYTRMTTTSTAHQKDTAHQKKEPTREAHQLLFNPSVHTAGHVTDGDACRVTSHVFYTEVDPGSTTTFHWKKWVGAFIYRGGGSAYSFTTATRSSTASRASGCVCCRCIPS